MVIIDLVLIHNGSEAHDKLDESITSIVKNEDAGEKKQLDLYQLTNLAVSVGTMRNIRIWIMVL